MDTYRFNEQGIGGIIISRKHIYVMLTNLQTM